MEYVIPYNIYFPFILLMIGLAIALGWAVIPTEITEENRPLLWGILGINIVFSIALFLFVYTYNTITHGHIFHIVMICTFLVALPITLYNLGVTSILFSN